MPEEPLPAEADALYGLPPGEFVAARDALAKDLRAAGRRTEAAAVKALRRPSAAAGAINRAARAHPDAVGELLAAGANLRRAQERLIAGTGDRAVLREASEHQREAVGGLARLAAAAAAEAGTALSAAVLDRVRETLQAVATDDRVRDAVAAGRLEREAGASGILLAPEVASGRPTPRRRAQQADDEAARAAREAADARLRTASEAVRRLDREVEDACREAERREATAGDLRARLVEAEALAEDARSAAEAARGRLREAKAEEAAAHAAREAATRSR